MAPMEDVTDISFRLMCKRFGADMVYTEFVSSDALIRSVNKTQQKLNVSDDERPVAIRMPGGALVSDGKAVTKDFGRLNTYEIKEKGAKVAVIGLGSFYPLGEQAAALIKEKTGVQPTLINPYYITGVDTDLLESL